MLVIGHRGAAGDAPENTLEALRLGRKAGADMLEFDVQLTRDGIPIVIHDMTLRRTHKKFSIVRLSSLSQIDHAAAKGHKIALLEDVLDEFFGRTLLNLELKSIGSATVVMKLLKRYYIRSPEDWDYVLISSFRATELYIARKLGPEARLALLHDKNPFKFLLESKPLGLMAAGFNAGYVTPEVITLAKHEGLFTYVYTVNTTDDADSFQGDGVEAVVSDYPGLLVEHFNPSGNV